MAQPIHFKAIVDRVARHGDDVTSYWLKTEERLPRFVPGQFIHLTIDPYDPSSFWPESRVFSVANAVADRHTIRLTISRQGAYTSRIVDELEPGSVVWGKGPYGDFSIDGAHGCPRAVLIAGGTGVTPFGAFMDAALAQGTMPIAEAMLHYGARTTELLIYRALADRCAANVPGFTVRYYAEHTTSDSDAMVQRGTLDIDRIVAATGCLAEVAFYLSGPPTMIDAFQERLIAVYGIAKGRVLIDAWE